MVQTGIQNVVTAATNLDKAMTNIRIVTGDSREEAVKYMKSLSGLAGQLGRYYASNTIKNIIVQN
jgi:hypothetical protein